MPKQEKSQHVGMRFPMSLHTRIQDYARDTQRSYTDAVISLIRKGFGDADEPTLDAPGQALLAQHGQRLEAIETMLLNKSLNSTLNSDVVPLNEVLNATLNGYVLDDDDPFVKNDTSIAMDSASLNDGETPDFYKEPATWAFPPFSDDKHFWGNECRHGHNNAVGEATRYLKGARQCVVCQVAKNKATNARKAARASAE